MKDTINMIDLNPNTQPTHSIYTGLERMSYEEVIDRIVEIIRDIRREKGISESRLRYESEMEGSCIGYGGGEIANLVWSQLVYTKEGYGDWISLGDAEIAKSVLEYLESLGY